MKRPILFISFLILLVIGMSVVHVSVANSLSTTGITLSKIQEDLATYKKENTLIKEQILEASALMTVSDEAKKAGYTPIKSEVSISSPLPLARR
jgi:cell division protein FtsL